MIVGDQGVLAALLTLNFGVQARLWSYVSQAAITGDSSPVRITPHSARLLGMHDTEFLLHSEVALYFRNLLAVRHTVMYVMN